MKSQVPTREALELAIKAQKWDRGSYEYALNAMLPYRCFSDSSIYKKADLIELFYATIPTKWDSIKGFTTFRSLTYLPVVGPQPNMIDQPRNYYESAWIKPINSVAEYIYKIESLIFNEGIDHANPGILLFLKAKLEKINLITKNL